MVYQEAMKLVCVIYRTTDSFPKREIFGLTSQMRRAAVSVSANISEGAARIYPKEFIRFLRISYGSLSELETLVEISANIGFLSQADCIKLRMMIKTVTVGLSGLMRAIQTKINNTKSTGSAT